MKRFQKQFCVWTYHTKAIEVRLSFFYGFVVFAYNNAARIEVSDNPILEVFRNQPHFL